MVFSPKNMQHIVFVYGTLKEGFPNFSHNHGVRVPGLFRTVERYPFYLGGDRFSPWLVNDPGHGERIVGQVFTVEPAALAAMDALERITQVDGYRRVMLNIESLESIKEGIGSTVFQASAYLKQPRHAVASHIRTGPISEYTLEHAAHYRPR